MKKLVQYFIDRSLLVNIVSIGLLIAGILYILSANREAFPHVEYDFVLVTTVYPGANAEDIEKHVTIEIEDQLREVEGIDELTSNSLESRSVVAAQLDPDLSDDDKTKAINDIKDAVDSVTDLPEEAEDPVVMELGTNLLPVLEISVSNKKGIKSDEDERELRRISKNLEDKIREIREVGKIDRQGYRDREYIVEVNPARMKEYYIGVNEIITALSQKNLNFPGGEIKSADGEIMIRTIGEAENVRDVENVLIRANDRGNWVRVKDVATVQNTFEEADTYNRTMGQPAITLTVLKKESADIINLVDEVYTVAEAYQQELGDEYRITFSNDISYYVKRRLNVLVNNGMFGFGLVLLVLFLSLGWRIALMTALGLPLAFSGTFVWMAQSGVPINLISMFGLIIVLGMLVDDAIVVAENVYRHLEEGLPVKEAVITGTSEVIVPVAGTIMTTIAAFAPLLFMTGIMGQFMWALPAVVSVALFASWVESMFILPSHIHDIEKHRKTSVKAMRDENRGFFSVVAEKYMKVLDTFVTHKYLVMLGITILFIGSLAFAVTNMKLVLFPQDKIERFVMKVEASSGTGLEQMSEKIVLLEKLVGEIPENELDNYITTVGMSRESPMDPDEKRGSNYATILVNLTPEEERNRKANAIINELRSKVKGVQKHFEKIEINTVRSGPPVGKAVSVKIKGEEFDEILAIAEEFVAYLNTIEGIKDAKHDYEEGQKELRIHVDERTASIAGISVYDVASTVRTYFKGTVATTIKKSDEEIDIRVQYPERYRESLSSMNDVVIANRMGNLVPLTEVASFKRANGITMINRSNWKRSITVSADIDENSKEATSVTVNQQLMEKFASVEDEHTGVLVDFSGEFEDTQESMQNLGRSFIIAVLVIYIILVGIFRSLSHPLIIIMVIPLSFIGVIWAFYAHGMALSFLAIMGVVGLAGVIVNDSILIVDFIKNNRARGMDLKEATVTAGGNRLRPIILTTITTFFGLIPTAYGIGGYDPFLKPMAVSMSWGILFGTVITLFITPVLYNVFSDFRKVLFGGLKSAEAFETDEIRKEKEETARYNEALGCLENDMECIKEKIKEELRTELTDEILKEKKKTTKKKSTAKKSGDK